MNNKLMFILLSWIYFFSMGMSCTSSTKIVEPKVTDSLTFLPQIAAGTLNNKNIDEASGLVASLTNSNSLWTHNDSGDKPRIFLISNTAQHIVTVNISGAENRDWEDIAIYKDDKENKNKILIGEIGDNLAVHPYYHIYILDEPTILSTASIEREAKKLTFKYPDGSKDAETLLVDPRTNDIYICSKREPNVTLYKIPYPYNISDTIIAQKTITLPFTFAVGGSISFDGSHILIKTYQKIHYWLRKENETIEQALSKKSIEVTYAPEPQGEAIAWAKDSKSIYTLSEEGPLKIPPVLYKFEVKK